MTNKSKKKWSEQDVQKWFEKLDTFNAIEPFVFERKQPQPQKRELLNDDRKGDPRDL